MRTLRTAGRIGLAAGLLALAAAAPTAARTVYVTDYGDGSGSTVVPLNSATNTVGSPITVGSAPTAVAVTPNGKTAYVTNEVSGNVTPIDVATNTAGTAITVGAKPSAIAITPNGKTAYVANTHDNTVTPIDLSTNAAGAPITVGASPRSIAITPDGKTAYVSNTNGNTVTPIDTATNTAATAITVGTAPYQMAITLDGKTLYVPDWGFNTSTSVTPIDVASNTAKPVITVAKGPIAVAITPDGKTAYVVSENDNVVTPIDVATNTAGATIPAGSSPFAIAITPDGSRAYVADENGGTGTQVTPIDLASRTPESQVTVGADPAGMAAVPDQSPVASFIPGPAPAGSPSGFDGSASSDPDGTVAGYAWDFGDGHTASSQTPIVSHAYGLPGTYTVSLTVTDNEGCAATLEFTGQTAFCPGAPSATTSHSVVIAAGSPSTGTTGTTTGSNHSSTGGGEALRIALVGGPTPRPGSVAVVLECSGPTGATCRGTVVLTTTEKRRGSHVLGVSARKRPRVKRKRVTLGSANYAVTTGHRVTVTVPIGTLARSLATRLRHVPTTVTITLAGVRPPQVLAVRTTLTGKKKKKKKKH